MSQSKNPQIPPFIIVGCGGAGCRILGKILEDCDLQVADLAIDTDKQELATIRAQQKILLGAGLLQTGIRGDSADAADAAWHARGAIEPLIPAKGVVFIIAGLGGGAGSGAAPQVARIAQTKGSLVISFIFLPVLLRPDWISPGHQCLRELYRYSDTVIVLDNGGNHQRAPHESAAGVFPDADGIIIEIIRGLVKAVTRPCLVSIDPGDLKILFKDKGLAVVLSGEAPLIAGTAQESIVRKCLDSPSLAVDYRSATGCMIIIKGGYDLNLHDTEEISSSLSCDLDPHTDIAWCADVEKSLEGRVRVYAIMTGLDGKKNRLSGALHG